MDGNTDLGNFAVDILKEAGITKGGSKCNIIVI